MFQKSIFYMFKLLPAEFIFECVHVLFQCIMLWCACLFLMNSLYCKYDEDQFSECAGNMYKSLKEAILSGNDEMLKDT